MIDPLPILFSPYNPDLAKEVNVAEPVRTGNHLVKIDISDVRSKINFWNCVVYRYVVGANPPIHVLEGFIRRIWRNFKINKVVMLRKALVGSEEK